MALWIILAGMTALCLFAVLRPLLQSQQSLADETHEDIAVYRDQLNEIEREKASGLIGDQEADAAHAEISRRLLRAAARHDAEEDDRSDPGQHVAFRRLVAACSIIGIPALGLAIYLSAGSPSLPGQPHASRQTLPAANQDMATLVARAEAQMRERPDDVRGWRVLAPAYRSLRRYSDSAYALEQVLRIEGRQPAVLAEYGEALVFTEAGVISKKARDVFEEANRLDKKLVKPQYYLALEAVQDGKPELAVTRWQALLRTAPADAPWRGQIETALARVQNSLKQAQSNERPSKQPAGQKAPSGVGPALDRETLASARDLTADQRSEMIQSMVQRLAARLDKNGGDLDSWFRLARAYAVLKNATAVGDTLDKARVKFASDAAALKKIDAMAANLKELVKK